MRFLNRFKRAKPLLRDYLYLDHRRLNSYLDQISSTTTHDKTRTLRLSVSLTAPSIQTESATRQRDKTDHEKVCELIEYLDGNGHLGRRRPGLIRTDHDDVETPDFVLEECDCVRVLIPPVDGAQPERGVVVWLSLWPLTREEKAIRPPGLLCIIQDTTLDDTRHRAGFSHSGYTWLQALLYQLHQQSSETQLAALYPLSPIGDYLHDLMGAQLYLQHEMAVLRPDPLGWLKAKGCLLSSARRIAALYRIRNVGSDEIGTENRLEDFMISTFAYGVAIWGEPNKGLQPTPYSVSSFPPLRAGRTRSSRPMPLRGTA